MNVPSIAARSSLPVILLCAVIQGWGQHALHLAITHHHWPATDPGWLLAAQALKPLAWAMIASVAGGFLYFGWFHGASVAGTDVQRFAQSGTVFPMAFELLLVWLVLLPFLQSRLATGSWIPEYRQLFAAAWRNKLTLAEACLFTTLFWALLGLWQMLFHLLGIDYFRELFQEPIFIYPVTALVFGIALHLIGSLEQWTRVVLEQLLSVLKSLALVAAVILTLFCVDLIPKLSTLVFSGHRAIDAGWLLWLVAVVVLFVNAAFRDGSQQQPYPSAIAMALRCDTAVGCRGVDGGIRLAGSRPRIWPYC